MKKILCVMFLVFVSACHVGTEETKKSHTVTLLDMSVRQGERTNGYEMTVVFRINNPKNRDAFICNLTFTNSNKHDYGVIKQIDESRAELWKTAWIYLDRPETTKKTRPSTITSMGFYYDLAKSTATWRGKREWYPFTKPSCEFKKWR